MAETETKASSGGGVTNENRGINIPSKSQEFTMYTLPGYELKNKTIDVYPQKSQQEVVTRSGEKPYSEVMPGFSTTELHYQHESGESEVSETYEELLNIPKTEPPEPVERISKPEKGIADRGLEPAQLKKKDRANRKSTQIHSEKENKKIPLSSPPPPTQPITPPPDRGLSSDDCGLISDLLCLIIPTRIPVGGAIVEGLGKAATLEPSEKIFFILAYKGVISTDEYRQLITSNTSLSSVGEILLAATPAGILSDLKDTGELVSQLFDLIWYRGKKIDIAENIALKCRPLTTLDREFRAANELFRKVVDTWRVNQDSKEIKWSFEEILENRLLRREAWEKVQIAERHERRQY